MTQFQLHSRWEPRGDQPKAIAELVANYRRGIMRQTLLGVTGSGKTFVMANVIQQLGIPAIVISHNKTLAAQLYSELKQFFPENAVEYFISYYDFYQPEAYLQQRDIYIEKEAVVNQQIDRLRMAATSALLNRQDVIIVASVSCIYSIGDPQDYQEMVLELNTSALCDYTTLLHTLVAMQYERNNTDISRSQFRVRGDIIEIWPSYIQLLLRVELSKDRISSLAWCDPTTHQVIQKITHIILYPARHYVMPAQKVQQAISSIKKELEQRLAEFKQQNKLLEAQRLEARTLYDLEMLQEVGYCSGIENYARHFAKRSEDERPYCLLDYFPKQFLTIVDESHVTIPQIKGMYLGDRSRKTSLIENGFRLPSALDNRPNRLDEWEKITNFTLFVSATPTAYELEHSQNQVIELVVRPTGLVDPLIEVHSAQNQVQDVLEQIRQRATKHERVLVTTMTKDLAERLTEYLKTQGIKVSYLHCDIDTFERVNILQDLRRGTYDAIVGINLLREGLDLPEVSLVAILDADRQGFLRTETSLIQTIGRAARNINAQVILYADRITPAIERAMAETNRRRNIQLDYNQKHNIIPQTIQKDIQPGIEEILNQDKTLEDLEKSLQVQEALKDYGIKKEATNEQKIRALEVKMKEAAAKLNFEKAAEIRDHILQLRGIQNDNASQSPSYIARKKKKRKF